MIRQVLFGIALLGASEALGGELLVGPEGNYSTIQEAIDAAEPGDSIIVAAGQYSEAIRIEKNSLTITGQGEVRILGGFKPDGTGDITLRINNAEGIVLENLHLRNQYKEHDLPCYTYDSFQAEDVISMTGSSVLLTGIVAETHGRFRGEYHGENTNPVALRAVDSTVVVQGGRFTGKLGISDDNDRYCSLGTTRRFRADGGPAIEAVGSNLMLREAALVGGYGRSGGLYAPIGLAGGDSVVLGDGSRLHAYACFFDPGNAGGSSLPPQVFESWHVPGGTSVRLVGTAKAVLEECAVDQAVEYLIEPSPATQIPLTAPLYRPGGPGSFFVFNEPCLVKNAGHLLGFTGYAETPDANSDGVSDAADLLASEGAACTLPFPWWNPVSQE